MRTKTPFYLCLTALALFLTQAKALADDKVSNQNVNGSLTDYLQQDVSEEMEEAAQKGDKSWINNLVDKVAEKSSQVFNNDTPEVVPVKRSNASVFDISGIMMRMDRQQVLESMQKRGYQKTAEHLEIPNFVRWRYEEQCRNQGVIGYERIGNCVILLAKKNNYQYVQHMAFSNFQTKETIDVYFTSNFTGNKVYRVMYETEAANIKGSGAKADYLRNIKVFDFWKKINQKYGAPDNREQVIWGLGDKKPSLQAATGRLVLEDPMLLELDYTRMSREDQKFMNTAVYTF